MHPEQIDPTIPFGLKKTTLLGILIKTIPELIRQAQTAGSKETREIHRIKSSIIRVRR